MSLNDMRVCQPLCAVPPVLASFWYRLPRRFTVKNASDCGLAKMAKS